MKETIFDKVINWVEKHPTATVVVFVISLLIIFFVIPPLVVLADFGVEFGPNTGPIGDTIGGITGPLIGLIAAILTFFAFWVQYRANKEQRSDIKMERFESKFFEMLRLHKENVTEMKLEGHEPGYVVISSNNLVQEMKLRQPTEQMVEKVTEGRDVFVAATAELKAIYEVCRHHLGSKNLPNPDTYLIQLAYALLFNGIESDEVITIDARVAEDREYVDICKKALGRARQYFLVNGKGYSKYEGGNMGVDLNFTHFPFNGYATKFSHYFRHLFLMVKYVVKRNNADLTEPQKMEYLRILRAQLSKHEQLMLYFNYLGGYGAPWETDKNPFFSTYKMIHNLPVDLTGFTIDPHVSFQTLIDKNTGKLIGSKEYMFEYDEKRAAVKKAVVAGISTSSEEQSPEQ
jgi:hypothetical protein